MAFVLSKIPSVRKANPFCYTSVIKKSTPDEHDFDSN